MYFADNEPGVTPASMADYCLILGGAVFAVAVLGLMFTYAASVMGWVTL